MKLEAFLLFEGSSFEIRPAPVEREWMDNSHQRYAYRCLPLNIANGHGWEILCPDGFSAIWMGGDDKEAIRITPDTGTTAPAVSHFGHGIVTFHIPVLMRTDPGIDLMVQGPINRPKDGIYPLSGIVESDWLPFTFTMNWVFTRSRVSVRFEKGEPFCHLFPLRRGEVEQVEPRLSQLSSHPELKRQHDEWAEKRSQFNADLSQPDSQAVREGWQKHYYKGKDTTGQYQAVAGHRTRLRVKHFEGSDEK